MFNHWALSRSAIEEASRPGADPIELINGVDICNLLKELFLGVKTKEIVSVDDKWFEEFFTQGMWITGRES